MTITFDLEQFEADVWYYSSLEGTIKSDTWEEIVAHCVNGKTIPGDHFMADVYNEKYCFNVKSIKEQFRSKTGNRTIEFVQCRTPISNDRDLSDNELSLKILETLDSKLNESLTTFNSEKMIDVIILHKRYDNLYHATVYLLDHPNFNLYNLTWKDGKGTIDGNKSWTIKRKWSDDSHRQTCTLIKNKYFVDDIVADVDIISLDNHNVSKKDIIDKYKTFINELQQIGGNHA